MPERTAKEFVADIMTQALVDKIEEQERLLNSAHELLVEHESRIKTLENAVHQLSMQITSYGTNLGHRIEALESQRKPAPGPETDLKAEYAKLLYWSQPSVRTICDERCLGTCYLGGPWRHTRSDCRDNHADGWICDGSTHHLKDFVNTQTPKEQL
jgi:hypothetical protein